MASRRATVVSAVSISDLLPSWVRSLEARNRSVKTVTVYKAHLARFVRWLAGQGSSTAVTAITKADMERYFAESLKAGRAAKSVADYHAVLKVFFHWCAEEGEITRSPMTGIPAPDVPESPVPLLPDAFLSALLRTCEGPEHRSFMERRDAAILRVFIDCGLRRSEVASMTVAGTDLIRCEADVLGKGRKQRTVAFHKKTLVALDRYLRIRRRHPNAANPALWLGGKGAMHHDGIYRVVKRRAKQAEIPVRVWPHAFRHGWSHQWLEEGGQEHAGAIMAGWESPDQFKRYGAAGAAKRAREAAKKMQGGDRL